MNRLDEDLEAIVNTTHSLWEQMRGKCIFITGGTGFFGVWLLHSFLRANSRLALGAKVVLLTRNKANFFAKFPDLVHSSDVLVWEGNVVDFTFPDLAIEYIIHAAVDADDRVIYQQPLLTLDTIIKGTRRVLDLAVAKQVSSCLLVSSGAVYGAQPGQMTHVPETFTGAPAILRSSSYAEGKRMAEFLSSVYYNTAGISVKIARCFAFVGPYLPLDRHYAIGNFIRSALTRQDIRITSDGTPRRSYMYTTDLTSWLWTVLVRGKPVYPYNIGSEEDFSLAEIAAMVAELSGQSITVHVARQPDPEAPINRYVPATARCRDELNLNQRVTLREAIRKTLFFHDSLPEHSS